MICRKSYAKPTVPRYPDTQNQFFVFAWLPCRQRSISAPRLETRPRFRLEVIDDLTTQKGLRALASEERKPIYDLVA